MESQRTFDSEPNCTLSGDGSRPSKEVRFSVFYPLAFTKWQVNFYAKADFGIPPINHILILNGVSSDGSNSYTPSNEPPKALDVNRYFNLFDVWK